MPIVQYTGPFDIARVDAIGDHALTFLSYPNGKVWAFENTTGEEFAVGDVVIHDPETNFVEKVPDELWPGNDWIGVVKHRTPEETVLEVGGRLVLAKTSDVEYDVNNTVVARDTAGVLRVLTAAPIRSVDLGLDAEPDVERKFRMDATGGPGFGDFAGMAPIMRRAKELIELPLTKRDKLERIKAKPPKGVLFTGDPGTGKTMLARIIAKEAGAAFYLVSGPQVNSKWFGESEQTIRALFAAAATHPRAIIFFDEIDSVASSRTGRGSEAQRGVVAQLLTEMDGFVQEHNVMVVAATNRPDDLDRALRRPGRFDAELHFPLPGEQDRLAILELIASKHETVGVLPHDVVAGKTNAWSSAELAGIFTDAAYLAAADDRDAIAIEDYLGGFDRAAEQHARRKPEETER